MKMVKCAGLLEGKTIQIGNIILIGTKKTTEKIEKDVSYKFQFG